MTSNFPVSNDLQLPLFETPALSASGIEFDPNKDFWKLDGTATINFKKLIGTCSPRFFQKTKSIAKILVETGNSHSAKSALRQFLNLSLATSQAHSSNIDVIDCESLVAWVTAGNNRNYIAQLHIFTNVAKTFEAKLLTEEAYHYLENMKPSPINNQLEAVQLWDPTKGALRPAEDQLLATLINSAFAAGKMSLRAFFVIRMLRGFAMRPSQLAAMKVSDVRDGDSGMHIRIPMAKQRNTQLRGEFMPWKPVSAGFADIIRTYLAEEVYPVATIGSRENAPLFWTAKMRKVQPTGFDGSIIGHANADNITDIYQLAIHNLNAISPLTGEKMKLNPRRERHTYATHLAMNGAPAEEIAVNLGQTHAGSCQPYIDATIGHFQSIENVVGAHYVAVGDRFIGNVVSENKDSNEFIIVNDKLSNVGSCGSNGCSAVDCGVAPLACYTCRNFNAWEEGPHQEILDTLLEEQINRRKDNHAELAETTTNTIIAINDLIERIKQIREKRNA
nr:site-specific integrase [uncultured Cohaesibacter sp.]